MKHYKPAEIEKKWQEKWEQDGTYRVDFDSAKPKFIGFGMFNYPSGAGIHVGHVRNFTIPDVITRAKRQQGFEAYQPVGWDSFGLPAENYAIKTGVAPQKSTTLAIEKYHDQYRAMGWAVDWTKEINTTDPAYYTWTQWIFAKLFEHGLAYQQESAQWWCDQCKTVLADEQVIAGKCWRHDSKDDPFVTKRNLKQWFFKITEYADEILAATDDLDWTQSVLASQKSWIGKSKGAEIIFHIPDSEFRIPVFTTRPDTLFGATFMVLAPEHELVKSITTDEQREKVEAYIEATLRKSEVQRQQDADKEKTGVFTGAYAVNPANDERLPVWIADYVLTGYGTGAIMAVPAHDERDYSFAKKFGLNITPVIAQDFGEPRDNETYVEGIVAIGYDPAVNKFLGLRNSSGSVWLCGGGKEKDETFVASAKRELKEETGYAGQDPMQLGNPIYSHYHNNKKNSNRRSFAYAYLFLLDSKKVGEAAREAHEDFEPEWFDFDALHAAIEQLGDGVGHWLEVLRRAKLAAQAHQTGEQAEFPAYSGEGMLINSGVYDGLSTSIAREKIVAGLSEKHAAREKTNYKMRDWLISRQRYWGAPIPIIHCEQDGAVAVPDAELPVVLPEIEEYRPTGGNVSVLAGVDSWVNTTCPKCGGPAKRETDTMDGYVCSSWYFLRYLDPENAAQAWSRERAEKWMPIDFYNGGDHATAHLLYARFFMRFFHKLGLVTTEEPFKKMVFNGKIRASDGSAFSKSRGNGIDPLEVIDQGYGADSIRLYEMFAAPVELDVLWDPQGIPAMYRFLNRVWVLVQEFTEATAMTMPDEAAETLQRNIHKTIKKVTHDIENQRFNTAIAAMMEAVNGFYKVKEMHGIQRSTDWRFALESLLQLLAPFAPHVSEELWHELGHEDSVHVDHWPMWSEALLASEVLSVAVQVNGKVRAQVELASDADEAAAKTAALAHENVQRITGGKAPKKVIYVPGRIVNIVV